MHLTRNNAVETLPENSVHKQDTASEKYKEVFIPAPPLASSRYSRQLILPSVGLPGQQRIRASRVLIVGLGGLGSPASLYLAGAGVGTLGFVDGDVVEESNLHRQIAHRESSVRPRSSHLEVPAQGGDTRDDNCRNTPHETEAKSLSKVRSAIRSCFELNSEVKYVPHEVRLTGQNALDIIRQYDIVLDCTDNPATRYLINDCCVLLGKILVSGAAQKLEGQMCVLNWSVPVVREGSLSEVRSPIEGKDDESPGQTRERGPCYRCIFPHPPSPELVKGCSEIGILGPVVGTIGTLMATETLRLIVKPGEARKPSMLLYSAWPSDSRSTFRTIGLRSRRADCVACGTEHAIGQKGGSKIDEEAIRSGSMDYELFCGVVEDIKLLEAEQRVDAPAFWEKVTNGDVVVVDVREQFEVDLGPKLRDSINIPISQILKTADAAIPDSDSRWNQLDQLPSQTTQNPIYFICQQGNDSQIAVTKLLDRIQAGTGESHSAQRWVGDVRGGFVALERYLKGERS